MNLWGHDLLKQYGAFLHIPALSSQAKTIMMQMGYNPLPSASSSKPFF